MNYKVVYFTRTGTSERVAEKIAAKLSCEMIQVIDGLDWDGAIGFIKGGYYSSSNKDVDITISKTIDADDELIVVSPMWAGGIAPAIKALLKTIPLDKVNLVVTSNGSITKNRLGYKSVRDIVKSKDNEEEIIRSLVNSLL